MKFYIQAKLLILLIISVYYLVGCGGGSGGDASFTINTSTSTGGNINPVSVIVNQNETTNFTVTPDTGYLINTVSGCGGSLNGNTYTTGTIIGECTVTANFVARTLDAVTSLFTNGTDWNDYVAGSDWLSSNDITCVAVTDTACLHGGEYQVVEVTELTDCTGLSATDGLDAFEWVCDNSTGTARFISTGLADDKNLSDLVDFTTPGFKANAVTVYENGITWGTTPTTTWWSNTVEINNTGGSLTNESTIYLVTNDPATSWSIDADKIALLIQPGVTVTGPGTFSNIFNLSNQNHLWLEGNIDANGDNVGVNLSLVNFSMIRNVTSNNSNGYGIYLYSASNNTLNTISAINNRLDGIWLQTNSNNNMLDGLTTSNNGNHGIALSYASNNNSLHSITATNNTVGITLETSSNNNRLYGIVVSNNTRGIQTFYATNNVLYDINASNNGSDGILLDLGHNNTLFNIMASNNGGHGINVNLDLSNMLYGITTSNNSSSGIYLNSSSNNTLIGITSSNNVGHGILLNSTSNNMIGGVACSNNSTGIFLTLSSNNTIDSVTASNNMTGIMLGSSSNNFFTGSLQVGNNSTTNCGVAAGVNPGLVLDTCTNNGSSNAILTTEVTLATSFVGKVSSDDTQNTSDTAGTASFPADPATFDWTDFDNSLRSWGIDGLDFPNTDQQGQWSSGTGRIWDWSVSTGDDGNTGSPALLEALALPTGNDTLTHRWDGTPGTSDNAGCDILVAGSVWNATDSVCETRFLRNAVKIQGDKLANDNTLCVSGETCLYMPNMGGYQGHGKLISAGEFSDGTLTGITLMKYENNGR